MIAVLTQFIDLNDILMRQLNKRFGLIDERGRKLGALVWTGQYALDRYWL